MVYIHNGIHKTTKKTKKKNTPRIKEGVGVVGVGVGGSVGGVSFFKVHAW